MILAVGANSPPPTVKANRHVPSWQSPDRPAPTIRADGAYTPAGLGGVGWLMLDDRPDERLPVTDKPPYRVPSMAEISAMPWNGYRVASLFSGCGGSSLGYRMAGFRVVWANEFIPAARDTYLANAGPHTVMDPRDIRTIDPAEVLAAIGLLPGELDLLDGSPPCASFSTSGHRAAGWGQVRKYSDTSQRVDDLFYEFVRLVKGIMPRVFVAENVSGLVKGTAKGYFIRIMQQLREAGYRVEARKLDAQWLGVPQTRQRMILIGVRNDLALAPVYPAPLPYRYSVRDALPHIWAQGDNGGFGGGGFRQAVVPSGAIGARPSTGNDRCSPSMVEARAVNDTASHCQVREPTVLCKDWSRSQGEDLGVDSPAPAIMAGGAGGSSREQVGIAGGQTVAHDPETGKAISLHRKSIAHHARGGQVRMFTLGELRAICGFPHDFVLTGTYEQRWERLGRAVPPLMMFYIARTVRDRILNQIPAVTHDAT